MIRSPETHVHTISEQGLSVLGPTQANIEDNGGGFKQTELKLNKRRGTSLPGRLKSLFCNSQVSQVQHLAFWKHAILNKGVVVRRTVKQSHCALKMMGFKSHFPKDILEEVMDVIKGKPKFQPSMSTESCWLVQIIHTCLQFSSC